MIKHQEVSNPISCLNRANENEMVFVLLARDPAAPMAIHAWAGQRIIMGKNKPDDDQIQEAYKCADVMRAQYQEKQEKQDKERNKIRRESDYINATNIAKVRTCMKILSDILPEGRFISEDESAHLYRCFLAWEQRLTRAVSSEARKEDKEPWLQKWPDKTL